MPVPNTEEWSISRTRLPSSGGSLEGMNVIVAEILKHGGRVSFNEFMELALYHPDAGYYTRPRLGAGPIGKEGDFITAPTASPLFARTFARLLERLVDGIGESVTFVELAAGEGLFLQALRSELGDESDVLVKRWVATEAGAWARSRLIAHCPSVEVAEDLNEVAPPHGPVVLFASELYDAMPVHRVIGCGAGNEPPISELFVEVGLDGALQWRQGETTTALLARYLIDRNVQLERGQIAEIRPTLADVHQQHLNWCGQDALVVIVDYGYSTAQLYNARGRINGTLVGYRRHEVEHDVLQDPGDIDITAHINFSDLQKAAERSAWMNAPLRPLGLFLAAHGAIDQLPATVAAGLPLTNQDWQDLQSAKNVLLPTGMGADLKVLVQGTGRPWSVYSILSESRLKGAEDIS